MEFVYVVKRYDLFDLSFPHGFAGLDDGPDRRGHSRQFATWTGRIREKGFFVERRWAEHDSSFKQVIPYTVVTHGDEVLLLKRLEQGGEARLHGKLSIGVGGHINPVDGDGNGDGNGDGDIPPVSFYMDGVFDDGSGPNADIAGHEPAAAVEAPPQAAGLRPPGQTNGRRGKQLQERAACWAARGA